MNLIDRLVEKLRNHPKRIVFTDGDDARILQAARQIVSLGMGVPILIGDRTKIKDKAAKLDLTTKGMRLVEPARSSDIEAFVEDLKEVERYKENEPQELRKLVLDPNIFATLMLKRNQAEAIISGATAKASSALRPLFQIIGTQENVEVASSLVILEMEEKPVGIDGALFMGDCGVIPDPNSKQLADIALNVARLANHLTNALPKVAMLSFSTHGNEKHAPIAKIKEATRIAKEKARTLAFDLEVEGDIQVDAALDMATAITKGIDSSPVAGNSNVLIFPDLNSGNIASKLVQILAGANNYGQIIMGLKRPAAEISRGASAHDILGAAAIVGCQAIDHNLLYHPEG